MMNLVENLIVGMGYKVLRIDAMDENDRRYVTAIGASGAFNIFQPDKVFVADHVRNTFKEDYILAHELGHLLSHNYNHNGKSLIFDTISKQLHSPSTELRNEAREVVNTFRLMEEYRADYFAINLLKFFNLEVPKSLIGFRLIEAESIIESQILDGIRRETQYMVDTYIAGVGVHEEKRWLRNE